MRIPWTRLALVAAVCISATSAMAAAPTNFDPTNHATRLIGLLGEDSGCTNTTSPGAAPSAPGAGCLVHVGDAAAVFTDPTNDFTGTITWTGPGVNPLTNGTNTFQLTIPTAQWGIVLKPTFAASGATLLSNTSFSFLFDATSGAVAAGNLCTDPPGGYVGSFPCYYQAQAVFAGTTLQLSGFPDPADYPYYGNSSSIQTPLDPYSGPPLVFSCAWSASGIPGAPIQPPSGLGPAGYAGGAPIPIPNPPCLPSQAEQGFKVATGLLPGHSIDFYQISTIELLSSPGTAYADAVWTDYKFWMVEPVDTDGDGVVTYPLSNPPGLAQGTNEKLPPGQPFWDNCPFTANPAQTDTGGVGVGSAPDGIGDVCQCGDVDNNGVVTTIDSTILKRSTLHLTPYTSVTLMPGFAKCDVNNNGTCDAVDATVISRTVLHLPPGISNNCAAAKCNPTDPGFPVCP